RVRHSLRPLRRLARLAPLLLRPLGPDRLGLDLSLRRALRLGDLSLRPLVVRTRRLVLDPGPRVGARLGELALERGLRGLGADGAARVRGLGAELALLGGGARRTFHPAGARGGAAAAADRGGGDAGA